MLGKVLELSDRTIGNNKSLGARSRISKLKLLLIKVETIRKYKVANAFKYSSTQKTLAHIQSSEMGLFCSTMEQLSLRSKIQTLGNKTTRLFGEKSCLDQLKSSSRVNYALKLEKFTSARATLSP